MDNPKIARVLHTYIGLEYARPHGGVKICRVCKYGQDDKGFVWSWEEDVITYADGTKGTSDRTQPLLVRPQPHKPVYDFMPQIDPASASENEIFVIPFGSVIIRIVVGTGTDQHGCAWSWLRQDERQQADDTWTLGENSAYEPLALGG